MYYGVYTKAITKRPGTGKNGVIWVLVLRNTKAKNKKEKKRKEKQTSSNLKVTGPGEKTRSRKG